KIRVAEGVIDHFEYQRVVAGVDVADDVRNRIERRVDIAEVIDLGVEGAAVAGIAVVVGRLRVDQVGVDEVAQLAAKRSQVADREDGVAAKVLLQREVILQRLRVLEVLVEILDTGRGQLGGRKAGRLNL